jgi:hypothetical protein
MSESQKLKHNLNEKKHRYKDERALKLDSQAPFGLAGPR